MSFVCNDHNFIFFSLSIAKTKLKNSVHKNLSQITPLNLIKQDMFIIVDVYLLASYGDPNSTKLKQTKIHKSN